MDVQLAFGIFVFGCLVIAFVFCHAISRDKRYSITESCKHENKLTQVVESNFNCETTIDVCADCDAILSEPKTDCR